MTSLHRIASTSSRYQMNGITDERGIRGYGSCIGKLLKVFGFSIKIKDEHGQCFYLNRLSAIKWLNRVGKGRMQLISTRANVAEVYQQLISIRPKAPAPVAEREAPAPEDRVPVAEREAPVPHDPVPVRENPPLPPIKRAEKSIVVTSLPADPLMQQGLNFSGRCESSGCQQFNKFKWTHRNFVKNYNMGYDSFDWNCSRCSKDMHKEHIAFLDCRYEVKAVITDRLMNKIVLQGETPRSQYSYISTFPEHRWMSIETKPIDSAHHHQPEGYHQLNRL